MSMRRLFRSRCLSSVMLLLATMLVALIGSMPAVVGVQYHGNTNTMKFHESSCWYYDCPHSAGVFRTRDAAIEAGYVQ